ncbi:MAG: glutamate-1-semialdehyde 2,1-aminomutase [Kiritimatiellia bacterium]
MVSSEQWFARAQKVIPGGVNSPVRSFRAVGGNPFFVKRGAGSRIYTEDGRELIDCCQSWGALLFGHAHPMIVEAVEDALEQGTSFGIATAREVAFAELLCGMIPGMDMVRTVNSGTEAVMTAIRLARGFTGRSCILKFDGCYHGHSDAMLVKAGSGLLSGAESSSAGVPAATAADTLVVPYNDIDAVETVMRSRGDDIAGIIVEPVAANMGLVLPRPGFLERLRELADAAGSLLLFDEVITGFRFGPTTYGNLCGVPPDLTCLGKIVGGGLPLAAVGGRRAVMAMLAPCGPVYQAGTLSGNPLAVSAGLAMLKMLADGGIYRKLDGLGQQVAAAVGQQGRANLFLQRLGGAFTPFLTSAAPQNLADVQASDLAGYAELFQRALAHGVYLPPSPYETAFISAAHTTADIAAISAVFCV